MTTFPYVERRTRRGEPFWSARVPVTILGGARPLQGLALVDTGADRTHIPLTYGRQLVDLAACERGSMVWGHDVQSTIYTPPGAWLAHPAAMDAVTVRPVMGDFGDLVLGMDFLEHYAATFDGAARALTLERHA